jgi:hypothetical protein
VDAIALETEVSTEARSCASADVLRAEIAERLGRDPFTTAEDAASATRRIRVAFARDKARAWTADIALLDANGNASGARALENKGATCEPLVASVVFTIAVLLEDLEPTPAPGPAEKPAPSPAPSLTEEEKKESPPPPPPPRGDGRAVRLDASIGPTGALGTAPAPAGGGELGIGIDISRFRIEVGGRAYLPASSDETVAVRTRTIVGRVAPCYGWTAFSACAIGVIGSISGEAIGDVASSKLEAQPYAAAGLGVLSRFFVVDDLLFVRASIDAFLSITRTGFDVGDRRVWTVPAFAAAGTLALGARLP